MNTQSSITHTITVAGGRYAPGHLGELTQHLPFEMVDEALTATKTTQTRLRDLPSRVVVYLILAACMFPEVGYPGVWRKLTAGLTGLACATPSTGGLGQARRCIGRHHCDGCSTCCAGQRPPSGNAERGGVDCWSARSTAPP